MSAKDMSNYHSGDVGALICRLHIPHHTLNDSPILKSSELGLITPELAEAIRGALVWLVCGGTMVHKAKGILWFVD
jgi:hypothetical protein